MTTGPFDFDYLPGSRDHRRCLHRVDLADPEEVDASIAAWIRPAYEAAG